MNTESIGLQTGPFGAKGAWWIAVALYAGAIYALSAQSHPFGIQSLPPRMDKLIHASVFGGFSLVLWMALRRSMPGLTAGALSVLAVVLTALCGLSDEIHQAFVPGRAMEALDWAADVTGAALMQWVILFRARAQAVRRPGGAT
ncbi:MAG TPA: VanZ family protein [Nitrospiria bacterium]|nr:VanZ family protein [Nitrospiria bacterium]